MGFTANFPGGHAKRTDTESSYKYHKDRTHAHWRNRSFTERGPTHTDTLQAHTVTRRPQPSKAGAARPVRPTKSSGPDDHNHRPKTLRISDRPAERASKRSTTDRVTDARTWTDRQARMLGAPGLPRAHSHSPHALTHCTLSHSCPLHSQSQNIVGTCDMRYSTWQHKTYMAAGWRMIHSPH